MPETSPHTSEDIIELPSRVRIRQRLGMLASRNGGREFNQRVTRPVVNFRLKTMGRPSLEQYVTTTHDIAAVYAEDRATPALSIEFGIDAHLIENLELRLAVQARRLEHEAQARPQPED